MENYNRNFNPIIEQDSDDRDSRGKKIKREERKRKRREGDEGNLFMSGDQFELKPYLKVLTVLRDQIIAERVGVLNASKNESIGAKYARPILQDLDLLFQKIASLITYTKSIMEKENKKLEIDSDSKEIESLTKQYQDLQQGYMKAAKDWKSAREKELEEKPIDQENQEIENLIKKASDLFDEAKTIFVRNTSNFATTSMTSSQKGDSKSDKESDKGQEEVKDFKLKRSETKGKIDERIRKIQNLYLEIFKGTKVEETDIYKSAKKYGADGKWGPTTAKMIDQIKLGVKALPDFKDKDLGGTDEINQNLIVALDTLKRKKSGTNESIETTKFLKTFESFMKEMKGINEADDLSAALDAMVTKTQPEKSSSGDGSKFDAFDSKEDGNKFRAWVNEKHPEWAKKNQLAKEGSHTNSYIKKAWNEFKDEYEKKEDKKEKTTESSAKEMAKKADDMLRNASIKIRDYYKNSDNFKEWKSNNIFKGGDNEKAAVKYIFGSSYDDKSSWFYKIIRRKYTKPVYQIIKKLKEGGEKYEEYYIHLEDELKIVSGLYSILKKKTYGGTSSDTHKWSNTNLDGEKKSFSVDTDF